MSVTIAPEYHVVVEARRGHDGPANGGHFGAWARVWVSRPGVATAVVADERHSFVPGRLAWHEDYLAVRVCLTDAFDPARDYLLVEHRCDAQPGVRVMRRERYELLAGVMPAWADFPARWREWVDAVANDAVRYLYAWARARDRHDMVADLDYACRKRTKHGRWGAWLAVADAAGVPRDVLPGGSWTAIMALPVRIAARLGWRSPVPRPRYEAASTSGRVLLAGPEGPVAA